MPRSEEDIIRRNEDLKTNHPWVPGVTTLGQACWNRKKNCPGIAQRPKLKARDRSDPTKKLANTGVQFDKTCEECDKVMDNGTVALRCRTCAPRKRGPPPASQSIVAAGVSTAPVFDFATMAMRLLLSISLPFNASIPTHLLTRKVTRSREGVWHFDENTATGYTPNRDMDRPIFRFKTESSNRTDLLAAHIESNTFCLAYNGNVRETKMVDVNTMGETLYEGVKESNSFCLAYNEMEKKTTKVSANTVGTTVYTEVEYKMRKKKVEPAGRCVEIETGFILKPPPQATMFTSSPLSEPHIEFAKLRIQENKEAGRLRCCSDASILEEPSAPAIASTLFDSCVRRPIQFEKSVSIDAEWRDAFVLGTSNAPPPSLLAALEAGGCELVCEPLTDGRVAAGVGIVVNPDPLHFSTAYRVYHESDRPLVDQIDSFVHSNPALFKAFSAIEHYQLITRRIQHVTDHKIALESKSTAFAKADRNQNFVVDGAVEDNRLALRLTAARLGSTASNGELVESLVDVVGFDGKVRLVERHPQLEVGGVVKIEDEILLDLQQQCVFLQPMNRTAEMLLPDMEGYARIRKRAMSAQRWLSGLTKPIASDQLAMSITRGIRSLRGIASETHSDMQRMIATGLAAAWNSPNATIRLGRNAAPLRRHFLRMKETSATPLIANTVDRALLERMQTDPEFEAAAAFALSAGPRFRPDVSTLFTEFSDCILRKAKERTTIPTHSTESHLNHPPPMPLTALLGDVSQRLLTECPSWHSGNTTICAAKCMLSLVATLYGFERKRHPLYYLLPLCASVGGGDTLGERYTARLSFRARKEALYVPNLDAESAQSIAECALRVVLQLECGGTPGQVRRCAGGWELATSLLSLEFS